MTQVSLQEWERAEIERSSVEAARTPDAELRAVERELRRYVDPPADTAYPLEYAFHLLGDVRGRTVLDFGCGSGENSLVLARRGARVVAFDISAPLLALAQRRIRLNGGGQVEFLAASAHELPLASGSVDVVFGIAILHHLDLDLVAAETDRVLAAGGRAIFQEPVRSSRLIRAARALVPYRDPEVSPFERPLTDEELQRFSSRFRESRSRAFGLPHVSLPKVVPPLRSFVRALHGADRVLLRTCPWLVPYAGVRVIEVRK